MILNIRPAVLSQIGEIIAAYASSLGATAEDCAVSAEYFAKSIESALLTAVITCDRVVRGVVVCESSPIPESCEIISVNIAEEYKGKGFGRKLLFFALREMRAMGCKSAFLWIKEGSTAAERFVRKIGFVPDGKLRASGERNGSCELRYRIDI